MHYRQMQRKRLVQGSEKGSQPLQKVPLRDLNRIILRFLNRKEDVEKMENGLRSTLGKKVKNQKTGLMKEFCFETSESPTALWHF